MNIAKLIADCGGASAAAKACGVARTAPYGWIRRQYVSSRILDALKVANPHIDVDLYLEGNETNDNAQRGAGISGSGLVGNSDEARHKETEG
jgi:hypothetical protein